MKNALHPTRTCRWGHRLAGAMAAFLWVVGPGLRGQDDVSDLLQSAKPAASAPATVTSPTATGFAPTSDALGTLQKKPQAGSRLGTVTLNNGAKMEGRMWTTLDTPLRLCI